MEPDFARTYSNVLGDRLAVGGFLTMDCALWDLVVACAAEAPPPRACSDRRALHLLLDDVFVDWRHDPEWCRAVLYAARHVAKAVRAGRTVLVACHHGLNRSTLVAGTALRLLGMPADQAVTTIQHTRGPMALSNDSFRDFLLHAQIR